MYYTFFIKQGVHCSNVNNNEADCTRQPGLCKWDPSRPLSSCYAEICPPRVPPPGGRPCCDVASGVAAGQCAAPETEITSVCDFQLPQCTVPQ